uniref:Uncharacterized protein n=1 Tax=Schistocephalus solidus TaxID=70667 RepID=A0A0X3Q0I8_SCHSO
MFWIHKHMRHRCWMIQKKDEVEKLVEFEGPKAKNLKSKRAKILSQKIGLNSGKGLFLPIDAQTESSVGNSGASAGQIGKVPKRVSSFTDANNIVDQSRIHPDTNRHFDRKRNLVIKGVPKSTFLIAKEWVEHDLRWEWC